VGQKLKAGDYLKRKRILIMNQHRIILYVYDISIHKINYYANTVIERETVNMESRNEHEKVYATNPMFNQGKKQEIADRPGKICTNSNGNLYLVWYYEQHDLNEVLNDIYTHIIDSLSQPIRDTEDRLSELLRERRYIYNQKEQLSINKSA
jgi:hypothetical protein